MLHFPTTLEIDITGKCNFSCLYCRNGHMNQCGDMNYEVIKSLIEECKKYHVFKLSISGGEPTLHNRFDEIVELIGALGIDWSLTTNGSNIDNKLARLLSANNLNSVFITLAGFSEETECYHKKKRFCHTNTMRAIEACFQNNIPISLGYLLTPRSVKEVDAFIDFCKEHTICAKLMRVEMQGNATSHPELQVSDDVFERVLSTFKSKLKDLIILGEKNVPFESRFCPAGILSCVVGYDNNVYPCVNFLGEQKVVCGSIKENTLFEIWHNSSIFNDFRMPRIHPAHCTLCVKRNNCNGGCRAEAYKITGDYKHIEFPCPYV